MYKKNPTKSHTQLTNNKIFKQDKKKGFVKNKTGNVYS